MNTLEDILRYHGDPGRAQIILWILVLFNLFHAGMIQQFNIMISYTPQHHCKPPNSNWTSLGNGSNALLYPDECSMYIDPTNQSAGTRVCKDGYEYITMNEEIYPSNEFNLVCDDFHWVESTLAITFLGVLIGGLVFGPISDRYGRQRSMAFIFLGLSTLSTSMYFVDSFEAFVTIRFLLGFLNQGLQTVGLTYSSELFLARMRTLTTAAVGIMWALMLPLLALLFYTLASWRYVHLIMGVMSCISAVYVWFMPESVSWLLHRWKIEEAVKVLNCFARFNKIAPLPSVKEDLEEVARTLRKRSQEISVNQTRWTQLFTTPIVRRIMFSLMYIWFTTACVVFGLSFSISALKGNNMYVNYVIAGFLEVVMRVVVMALFVRYGRVAVMSPVLFSCGVLTIVGFMIWYYVPGEYHVIQMIAAVIALIGRNMMAVNFTMVVIFTSELTPVALRSTGVGFGFAAARFGNVLSPYTRFLRDIWTPLPQTIYGIMAILAGFVIMTLPETFNKPLPNTIQDVQELVKTKKAKSLNLHVDLVASERAIPEEQEQQQQPHLQSLIYKSSANINNNK